MNRIQMNNYKISQESGKRPLGRLLNTYIILTLVGIIGLSIVVLFPNWWGSFVIFILFAFLLLTILAVIRLILFVKFLRRPLSSIKEIKGQVGSKSFVKVIIIALIISGIISIGVWFLYNFNFIN